MCSPVRKCDKPDRHRQLNDHFWPLPELLFQHATLAGVNEQVAEGWPLKRERQQDIVHRRGARVEKVVDVTVLEGGKLGEKVGLGVPEADLEAGCSDEQGGYS